MDNLTNDENKFLSRVRKGVKIRQIIGTGMVVLVAISALVFGIKYNNYKKEIKLKWKNEYLKEIETTKPTTELEQRLLTTLNEFNESFTPITVLYLIEIIIYMLFWYIFMISIFLIGMGYKDSKFLKIIDKIKSS